MSSDYEGFPNALVEAMANGIPSISTDFPSGAAHELIGENERGWLVPVRDSKILARTMYKALSDPHLANQKALKASEYTKKYRGSEIFKLWLSAMED